MAIGDNPFGVTDIIFDFGGVLFDIDYDLPIRAFEQLGYPDFGALYTQAAQNQWFDDLETGRIDNESFYAYLHSLVPSATRAQVVHAWNVILLHLRTDEVRFVKQLRQAGYGTYLLSNTNAIHAAEFERAIDNTYGLAEFRSAFDKVYYSHVIGMKKPYPSTFLEVCAWNGMNPATTLFVDDSIQHVEGAAKAGLRTYHLKPGELISVVFQEFL